MKNKSIFIGNYKGLDIFYNSESKTMETSGFSKNSFDQDKLVGLILISIPFIKIINSFLENIGLEARIIILLISAIIGLFVGFVVTSNSYRKIELSPMSMNKYQFEQFYSENENNLKIVKWILIISILSLFIEIYIYLKFAIFLAVLIFLFNTLIVTMLLLIGVHSRQRIFKEIESSYLSK